MFSYAEEQVVLQLKWKHQFQFAGYYMAKEKGFYTEEGFDVEIRERDLATSPVHDVLEQRATFGISDSSIVLQRLQGKPVVVLSAIFQHSPLVLLALADSGIRVPEDILSKKVSYQKSIDGASITAMFSALGIEKSQYEYVPYSFNDNILIDGGADVFSAYITDQPALYKNQNVDVTILDPRNYGIDFYGDMIFSSQEYVQTSPERAQAFVNASLKGWEYALANQEESVALIKDKYQSEKSADLLRYEAKTTKPLIYSSIVPIGTTYRERFIRIADTYYELGMVDKKGTLKGLVLADYVKKPRVFNRRYLLAGISLMLFLLAVTVIFNRRLHNSVKRKTVELRELNADLQTNYDLIEEKNVQLELASKSKSIFVANMSHEIRTPLNGIYGSLQLLKSEQLTKGGNELLDNAMSSSVSLLKIINDILDFSKIEAGKLELAIASFDLVELVESTHEQLKLLSDGKDIEFKLEISPDFHAQWLGDSTRVRQVLINILSNSIKFTENGIVSLQCKMNKGAKGVEFVVQDTGIGMDDDTLHKLFEQFSQADSSTTRKYGGTGLGMSICQTLVSLMGGNISVKSELGKGSEFTITLPLDRTELPESNDKTEVAMPDLTGKTVLIAEDNRINQIITQKMLMPTQANIIHAKDGKEALSLYELSPPDLILMDIQMPEMDGKEACRRIRERNNDIVIIALTANVMKNDVEDYLASGFNDHLGKPLEQQDLYRLLLKYAC